MTKTNNTTEDRAGDGIEERAKAYFNNFHIVQKMDSAEVAEITAIGSRFVTAETATLTTQLNEMREALRELIDVKGSPIKSWAAIGEDFEFWWGRHSDLITALDKSEED